MLSRSVAVAAVLCLVSSVGFAAPAKAKKKSKAVVEESEQGGDEPAALGSSSGAIRAGKPFGAALLYTPLSDFVLQYGVGGIYNMNQDIQLGFDFLTGTESLVGDVPEQEGVELTKADLSGMAFYAYGRYFIGNSFNVKAGLGYRSADIAYRIEDSVSGDHLSGDVSLSSIILPIAIGNHWVWDSGLTVGVDWLTYMVALGGSSEASTETSFSNVEAEVEEVNDDMLDLGDDLAHTSSLTLALVTFGYLF